MSKRTVRAETAQIPTILVGVLRGRSVEFSVEEIQELLESSREATLRKIEKECQPEMRVYRGGKLVGVRVRLSSLTEQT